MIDTIEGNDPRYIINRDLEESLLWKRVRISSPGKSKYTKEIVAEMGDR